MELGRGPDYSWSATSSGTDIIDQHPDFDGRNKGGCSGRDFGIFAHEVTKLAGGGVVLNVGSAITGPEVLLKTVSMAGNVGKPPMGLITANGGFLTKHAMGVYSTEPPPQPFGWASTQDEVDALIGTRWRRATTVCDLAELLPDSASWPLAEVTSPRDLWTAERAVVRRVDLDAKQDLVDDVFHKVAGRYDLMNDLMSAGLHRIWKDVMVTRLGVTG